MWSLFKHVTIWVLINIAVQGGRMWSGANSERVLSFEYIPFSNTVTQCEVINARLLYLDHAAHSIILPQAA